MQAAPIDGLGQLKTARSTVASFPP